MRGPWPDGCPRTEEPLRRPGEGPALVVRTYLDPGSGRALHVETVPAGTPRAFAVEPHRWTRGRTSAHSV